MGRSDKEKEIIDKKDIFVRERMGKKKMSKVGTATHDLSQSSHRQTFLSLLFSYFSSLSPSIFHLQIFLSCLTLSLYFLFSTLSHTLFIYKHPTRTYLCLYSLNGMVARKFCIECAVQQFCHFCKSLF